MKPWLKWYCLFLVALLGFLPPFQAVAQEQPPQPSQKVPVTVKEGTRVRVRILQELSSKTANVGDVFQGEVFDDTDVDGKIAIAKGASAVGVVTAVQRAAWLGKPGRLGFTFEHAKAVDGTNVRVRVTAERVAQGNEALAWGLGLILFLPFLLIRGQEMEIKHGTLFTTFVDKDTSVSVLLPPGESPAPAPSAAPAPPPSPGTAPVTSPPASPAGAPPVPPAPLLTPPSPSEPSGVQVSAIRTVREISGGTEFGVLVIGSITVLKIGSAFEGLNPFQRAEAMVEKLNRLVKSGLNPQDVKHSILSGRQIIFAKDEILLTVDAELARSNGTSASVLAELWVQRIQEALRQLR